MPGNKVKAIFSGDMVERIGGVYAGIVGRVVSRKPKNGPWASYIKVDVDIHQVNGNRKRNKLRLLMKRWSSVTLWKVVRDR